MFEKHGHRFSIFTRKPHRSFSRLEERLVRLKWPLYYYLIGANIAVWLAWNSGIFSNRFMFANFSLSRHNMSMLRLHTLVTYNFSHIGLLHLLSNSVGLFFIGRAIEGMFGPRVLLLLYLAGGLTGGLVSLLGSHYKDPRPTVGASASISALLGFFIMNFPKEKLYIIPFPFGIPAWLLGSAYMIYSLAKSNDPFSSVQHKGHLSGMLTGIAYYFIFHGIVI